MDRWSPFSDDAARVHQAANEAEALLIQRILEDANIPVVVRSRQVPGYGEIIKHAVGVWGDIVVPKAYEESARRYIAEYLHALKGDRPVSRFAGIIPPLVTLFDGRGRIDEEANERHIDFLIAQGVHGLFALGSTGEVMHLSADERRRFAALVVGHVNGRVPVLIGCASTSSEEAAAFARHAQESGADGVVALPPYYWAPPDRSIETHISAVAAAVELPVVIYNFPSVVGRSISPDVVASLARSRANVLGIKETIDSIAHIQLVIARVKPFKPEFSVLCGYEFHVLNTLLSGGDGAIPAIANFAPAPSVELYERYRQGQIPDAAAMMRQRLPLAELYQFDAPFFVVVKEAMALFGLVDHVRVRPPATPLSEDARARLRSILTSAGLL